MIRIIFSFETCINNSLVIKKIKAKMSEIDETTPLAPNPTANSIPPQIAVTMAGAGPGPEPSITQTKPVIIHNFPQANPIPVQFGPNPISLVCGNCGASVLTNCIKTHSSKTTTWFWICCLIG